MQEGHTISRTHTDEEVFEAVRFCRDNGMNINRTIRALGYPSSSVTLKACLERISPDAMKDLKHKSCYPEEDKTSAAAEYLASKEETSKSEIARKYGISRTSLHGHLKHMEEDVSSGQIREEDIESRIRRLEEEARLLEEQNYRLRIENAIIRKATELISKKREAST